MKAAGFIRLLACLLLFSPASGRTQVQVAHYAGSAPNAVLTPDSLSRQLTSGLTTDLDKVRAIFNWIASNIQYNTAPWRNAQYYLKSGQAYDDNDTGALKPLSERVAIDVLKKRIAFCDGYARLFKTMCDYAGIRCEVVTGFADIGNSIRRLKFSSNHRWNAVYIDSAWQLLDVTWASGYMNYALDYVPQYNNRYFLTPPGMFAHDHYPEELQWMLLPDVPEKSEYRFSPFKTNAFVSNRIESYKPESGILQALPGDTLRFEITTTKEDKKLMLLDTAYVNDSVIARADSLLPSPAVTISGNVLKFWYVVPPQTSGWLHLVMNDDVVMRYHIVSRAGSVAMH